MLAYVFWHWPQPDVSIADYESRMCAFQDALAAEGPRELRAARAWRIAGAPWLPSGTGYEEWYLLDDTAALEALNTGAVSGPLAGPHNAVAALAAGGTAGLYQTPPTISSGTPSNPGTLDGATVRWFSKPAGLSYPGLYARLGDSLPRLWVRMMVLGPTPECCLLVDASDDTAAISAWHPLTVQREPIWPPPA